MRNCTHATSGNATTGDAAPRHLEPRGAPARGSRRPTGGGWPGTAATGGGGEQY